MVGMLAVAVVFAVLAMQFADTHNFKHVFDFKARPRRPDPLPMATDGSNSSSRSL